MPILHNSIIAATAADDPVTRSLRLDDGNNSNLYKATGSTNTTWTVSMWVKRSKLSSLQYFFSWGGDGINFDSSDRISIWNGSAYRYTTAVFRDTSNWYHLTISCNAGTITIYVNGVAHALSSSVSYPAWGNVYFGRWSGNTSYNFDGYLADIYGIEGSALDHTSFTESNSYGGLKPKAYTGSFGTNGFHLDAQPANDSDLMVSSVGRNDGDTTFVDVAKGHTITKGGDPEHSDTVGNPFGSGTAIYFDGSGDYLNIGTTSDFRTTTNNFTLDFWFKPNGSSTGTVFSNVNDGNVYDGLTVNVSSVSVIVSLRDSSSSNNVVSLSYTNDDTDWHHAEVSRTGSTLYLFVDGNLEDSGSISFTPTNSGLVARVGRVYASSYPSNNNYAGYLFDYRWSNSGGHTASFTAPTAPLELNPVYIGGDQSGNKNHFTPTNISSHDVMLDTPTANYPVLNVLDKDAHHGLATEGNLLWKPTNSSGTVTYDDYAANISATMQIPSSGKWYFEFRISSVGNGHRGGISITNDQTPLQGRFGISSGWNTGGSPSNQVGVFVDAYTGGNVTVGSTNPESLGTGDYIMSVAIDSGAKKLWARRDGGSWYASGDPSNGTNPNATWSLDYSRILVETCTDTTTAGSSVVRMNFGADPTFQGTYTTTPATSEFAFDPPTNFVALNSSNLDAPTVTPSENFGVALYNGNSSTNAVTGLGFEPSLLWTKSRSTSGTSHKIYDSVRGVTKKLETDNTTAEGTVSSDLTSFDSDGFTLGSGNGSNYSGRTYVSWNWKAHQSPTSSSTRTTYTVKLEDSSNDAWDAYGSWYDSSTYLPSVYMEIFENRNSSLVSLGKVAVRYYDSSGNSMSDTSEQTYTLECADLNAIAVTWHYDTSGDGQEYDSPCSYNDYLNDQKITILDGTSSTSGTWLGVTGQSGVDNYSNDNGCTDYNYSPPTGWADGDTLKSATTSYNGSDTATLTSDSGASDPVEKYNAAAGFTIISYSGTGSSSGDTQALDHSLGVPLEFVIAKARTNNDSYDNGRWIVYHKDLTGGDYLMLNSTAVADTPYEGYDIISTSVSGSQHKVVVGNDCDSNASYCHYLNSGPDNGTGEDYILYGWAGVEGYSKFGTYEGNGSTDGPFIYTGFRPAFVLIKNIGASQDWFLLDNKRDGYNVVNDFLEPNTSNAEATASTNKADFTANGFKLRGSGSVTNQNNTSFVYACFSESPFKHANAR